MLLWLIWISVFAPAILKQNLLWLFLWQNREYRTDKMLDYLSLLESKNVVFDKWSKVRLFLLFLNFCVIVFQLNSIAQTILIGLFVLTSTLECVNYFSKVFSKKIKLPNATAKAGLIFILSLISSFILPFVLSSNVTIINYSLEYKDVLFLTLWNNFILFCIPLIVGYWILIIFPFDLFIKNKLFNRAKTYRNSLKNLKTIAISGAFGKTTTKEMLYHFLQGDYKVEKILKNQNSNVSCARRTLSLETETDFFICELGAYKKGDGNEICEFIEPNSAIITGLNYQHFSLFGNEKNIISAESESLKFLNKGEIAIVNWSSPLCHKIDFPDHIKLIKCGIENMNLEKPEEVQYLAKNVHTTLENTTFDLEIKSGNQTAIINFKTSLVGKGVVQNILHSIAFCLEHNLLDLRQIQNKIQTLPEIEGRMQVIPKNWGKIVYNQYNNPDGVISALELFSGIKSQKVVVLDDILELGKKSREIHSQISDLLFNAKPDLVLLLGRNFSQQIKSELINKGYSKNKILLLNGKNYLGSKAPIQDFIQGKSEVLVLLMGFQSKEFLDL